MMIGKKNLSLLFAVLISIALCLPTAAFAKKSPVDSIKGILKIEKRFYNVGEDIKVSVKFSQGSKLLANGTVDAYIIVFSPDLEPLVFQVDPSIGAQERRFVGIEFAGEQGIQAGRYQLGIIVTAPGGNPMDVADWYAGFKGLRDLKTFVVSGDATPVDSGAEESVPVDEGTVDEGTVDGGTTDDGSTEEVAFRPI